MFLTDSVASGLTTSSANFAFGSSTTRLLASGPAACDTTFTIMATCRNATSNDSQVSNSSSRIDNRRSLPKIYYYLIWKTNTSQCLQLEHCEVHLLWRSCSDQRHVYPTPQSSFFRKGTSRSYLILPLRLIRTIRRSWKHFGVLHHHYYYHLDNSTSNLFDMPSSDVDNHIYYLQGAQQIARMWILCFHHVSVDGCHWLTAMTVVYLARTLATCNNFCIVNGIYATNRTSVRTRRHHKMILQQRPTATFSGKAIFRSGKQLGCTDFVVSGRINEKPNYF